MGLVTNHSMSTTTYSHPNCFRFWEIHFAFNSTCFSLTVVPYPSQLFHPKGGVLAISTPVSVVLTWAALRKSFVRSRREPLSRVDSVPSETSTKAHGALQ